MFTSFTKPKVIFEDKFQHNNLWTPCLQSIWTSSFRQVLLAQPDVWKEALDYDKYVIGIFKCHKEDLSQLNLVEHALA